MFKRFITIPSLCSITVLSLAACADIHQADPLAEAGVAAHDRQLRPSTAMVDGLTAVPDSMNDNPDAVEFHTGHGPARGHEDLVRFAVGMANDYIAQYAAAGFYPSVQVGVAGPNASHPIVKGNYETDFPSDKMRAFHNAPDADWHNDEALANMHSTRNFPNGVWESAYSACEGTKDMIANATREAARHIQSGNLSEAYYWIGHATHTIQDSFSTAHTQRTSDWTITDVCTYGEEIAGACYHHTLDLDDRIWRSTWWCQLNPWARSWSCLKEEAKLASLASAGYLIMMEWFIDGYVTNIDASLDAFLEGNMYYPRSGYFTCNAL